MKLRFCFYLESNCIRIVNNKASDSQVSGVDGDLVKSQCAPSSRVRRQLPGGDFPVDINDENVQLYLKEALAEINAGEEPNYK